MRNGVPIVNPKAFLFFQTSKSLHWVLAQLRLRHHSTNLRNNHDDVIAEPFRVV